jgi:20S proteasome subunit alpha 4
MALTGLNADARILANLTRVHCQSFRLDYDDAPSIEIIAKYVASTKHKYTQRGGVRPFGLSTLLAGFDPEGRPHLYSVDPSGMMTEWRANACGRNSKQVS